MMSDYNKCVINEEDINRLLISGSEESNRDVTDGSDVDEEEDDILMDAPPPGSVVFRTRRWSAFLPSKPLCKSRFLSL